MEIVKKNVFAITCGVIALLAFIAFFWPVGTMYGNFDVALKKRVDVDLKIRGLKMQNRIIPAVGGPEAKPLTHFPNQPTIDAVKAATDLLKQNTDQALQFVVELNHAGHDLLEPGSLPVPLDNNQYFHFRSQYNAVMDYGGKPDPWNRLKPEAGPLNLLDQVLNATKAASQQEIEEALKQKWEADYHPKVYIVNGQEQNLAEVKALFEHDTANFVKEFHEKRASQFKIYCDPGALTRAPKLNPDETPNAQDIWFAQMTLWIEQDVCQTIREMNKNVLLERGQGIEMSPVKHLIDLGPVYPNIQMYVMGMPVGGTPGGAAPTEIEPTEKRFEITPTGRVCNTLYDVVHFHVTVVIDPRHLQEFLEKLRYQRLLTVTSMAVQDVDWKAAEDLGYVYGPTRCVQVSLDCEDLFMRDWTVRQLVPDATHPAPMPLDVQKMLGIPPAAPAGSPTLNKVAMQ